MKDEYRTARLVDAELDGMNFHGKVAVFDEPWSDQLTELFGYEEIVRPGAFIPALRATPNVPFLREHDQNRLLATTRAGTLTLAEDGKTSLRASARLPHTALGEETRALIETGDLGGMSYGVRSKPGDSKLVRTNGRLQRIVNQFRQMIDVSITWDPAYPGTNVELRSLAATLDELEAIEADLDHEPDDESDNHPPDAVTYARRTAELITTTLTEGWPRL